MTLRFKSECRVKAVKDVDYAPYARIRVGELGTVVNVEQVLGEFYIDVLWDDYHVGLSLWTNHTLLVEPDISAVVPIPGVRYDGHEFGAEAEREHDCGASYAHAVTG